MIRKAIDSVKFGILFIVLMFTAAGCQPPVNIIPGDIAFSDSSGIRSIAVQEVGIPASESDEYRPHLGADGESEIIVYTRSVQGVTGDYETWELIGHRIDDAGCLGPEILLSPPDDIDKYLDSDFGAYPGGFDPNPFAFVVQAVQLADTGAGMVRIATLPEHQNWNLFTSAEIIDVATFFDHAAFTCIYEDDSRVFAHNIVVGQTIPLYNAGTDPQSIDIGSDYVVWDYSIPGGRGIQAVFIADGVYRDAPVIPVMNFDSIVAANPSTYGSWVAYTLSGAGITGTLIELANLETGERIRIADDGAEKLPPSMDGDLVAYASNSTGNYEIYVYCLSTGKTYRVTNHPADQIAPYLHGNKVAYQDSRNGNLDVYFSTIEFVTAIEDLVVYEIAEINDFVDLVVEYGTLEGDGNGSSADGRLHAFMNMLQEVYLLIDTGDYEKALGKLLAILKKTDGDPRPPDFVTGEAAVELAELIDQLIEDLELLQAGP